MVWICKDDLCKLMDMRTGLLVFITCIYGSSMRSTSVVAQHVSHPLLRVVSSRGGGLGATEELQVVRQMVVLVTWQPGATLLGHLAACERELSAESTCSLTIDGAHRRCLPPSLDPSSSLLSERRLFQFLMLSCLGHHVPCVRHLFLVRLISFSRLLPFVVCGPDQCTLLSLTSYNLTA